VLRRARADRRAALRRPRRSPARRGTEIRSDCGYRAWGPWDAPVGADGGARAGQSCGRAGRL